MDYDEAILNLKRPSLNMNNSVNVSPKARPLPQFFAESATFSTKKEKETPKLIDPPRPPIKSCPPISRLKQQRKPDFDGARVISFINNNTNSNENNNQSEHNDSGKN